LATSSSRDAVRAASTTSAPSRALASATAALRRAARLGDGWLHGGGDLAELPALLTRLAEHRRAARTDARPFEVHVISADVYTVDGVARLAD
jgi:alkanesulfonate monooxygenase SsuD/methylene tetrahydromethanopterin reductase-like flavin-dependent oxidoreductase (luciferase family)